MVIVRAVLVMGLVATATLAAAESCPEQTRPHATRCDQYFRCVLLPSKTHVWVPTQCEKGLIYEPQLKTCVLPGDDWECNLSAEVTNESGENVYGINNLPAAIYTGPTVNPVRPPMTTSLGEIMGQAEPETVTEQQAINLPTISGDNEGYYIVLDRDGNNRTTYYHTPAPYQEDEEDFSGDGQPVEGELPVTLSSDTMMQKHSTTMVVPTSESSELSKTELNSFLADYTLKTSSETPTKTKTKTKTKNKHPLPPDGKIHPEHLSSILTQQKKLNKIASQLKLKGDPTGGVGDKSPFTDQPVFTSRPGSVLFNMPQRLPEESNTKSPFMSEDVIRSIIEISKQMMTNQKPQMEEMYVKPIFIPISVSSATQDFTPNKPSKIMFHQMFPSLSNNTSQFSAKPIGITITNPYTLGQATIYDNLRDQIMNDSQYYNYQAAVVDAYGNRYPTQSMPNVQMYPSYPPTMAYPVFSQPSYQYPQNNYYEPAQVTNRLRNTIGYDNDDSQSTENAISEEDDDTSAELPEKEVSAALTLTSNEETNDESEEQLETKKLISVGGATLNYNDYKDSILPLLNANPDEVRISVLTCSLGSRQPNKTDCTKYYVCNPHNGAFQSFTCPSFTAFNADTRVCDMATYKSCQATKPNSPTPPPTALTRLAQHKIKHQLSSDTNKLQNDLLTAHKYVDLIKKEAIKILSRNKVSQTESLHADDETELTSSSPTITTPMISSSTTKRHRNKPKRKNSAHKKRTSTKNRSAVTKATSRKKTTTSTPTTTTTVAPETTPAPKPPKCKQNGKMPDPAVKNNYYVCYKANPKKFIKTRMACPNKLVYCAATEYCTFEKSCKK